MRGPDCDLGNLQLVKQMLIALAILVIAAAKKLVCA
jgi:hypothetical protein